MSCVSQAERIRYVRMLVHSLRKMSSRHGAEGMSQY